MQLSDYTRKAAPMAPGQTIAISGDLGSGKSTVAVELARRLGLTMISVGALHGELARSRGMSALQLNRHSERDADIDAHLDGMQRDLARSGEPLIVDSRLGWYFFTDAFKVHLKADPMVAAGRAMDRQAGKAESYRTREEASQRLHERSESERARFLATYGVDKARLRNYSLVCDTTQACPEEIVDAIITTYARDPDPVDRPTLFLDPARVLLTSSEQTREPVGSRPAGGGQGRQLGAHDDLEALRVEYARTRFFAVAGHARVRAAVERGDHLIQALLVAEVDERLASGSTA